jgi:hypothetical protein
MRNIFLTLVAAFLTCNVFALTGNPALNIYTSNVENRFEVGSTANIFVELMTDIDMPNGESEIEMDGIIVGYPPISLEMTKISKTLYLYTSPVLSITDVGERYFQVQLKARSKKAADRIKAAIQTNLANIDQLTIAMNSSTDEQTRVDLQGKIDRLIEMNHSLEKQLNSLFVTIGTPRELGIRVIPKNDENNSIPVSQSYLSIEDGSMGEYSIKLNNRPVSDVTIRVQADTTAVDLNETLDNQIDLVFTPENYTRPQAVRVGIPCDTTVTQFEISHEAFSLDTRFNGLVIENVSVNVLQE